MKNKVKVVLAEDEPSLGQIVEESLESRGFEVFWCQNGNEAVTIYEEKQPDILVLDVMMPEMDGFEVAQQIRKINQSIPIIFLTARSQTKDVIEGFGSGGNDYIKKPFSMEELIVRINALLRRVSLEQNHERIEIGAYIFNYPKQLVVYKDEEQMLTHREAELLFWLAQNRNNILDRAEVLKKVWGDDDYFNARSMDVFITRLRKKLKKDPSVQIVNVRGYGYKLIC